MDLPSSFTPIRALLDQDVTPHRQVSVIGAVKDHRLPVPTRGADFKCCITLYDTSTEEDNDGIDFNIFRREEEMPSVQAGDIVVVFSAKFQIYGGGPSLLSSYSTDIHVYDSQRLLSCKKSGSASGALKVPTRKIIRKPDERENRYVLSLFDRIDKSFVPDPQEFSARAQQSLNVKDKFRLLQDVGDHNFADLVVQVVREPFDFGDRMTLWVSDYTENHNFFNRTTKQGAGWNDGVPSGDGDPYGYTDGFRKKHDAASRESSGNWMGPPGKKSLQVTCWEPHAEYIRENVHGGDWVRLRNVQIGYGHNATNIEAFLRGDRQYPGRVYVVLLDPQADRESIDPHLFEALRRKLDYEKEDRRSLKAGKKRKLEDLIKEDSSKGKRARQREEKRKAFEDQEAKQKAALGLNPLIKSEYPDQEIVPLSSILEPVLYQTTINQTPTTIELPFTNARYRTNARVIDFHPVNLKDFSVSRQVTEYPALSDNESSDPDSDRSAPGGTRLVWEWRFALKLECIAAGPLPKGKNPATVWVLVDHFDAQCLTGLDDAADLHSAANSELLRALREQMFRLWGNLEERKSRAEAKRRQHTRDPLKAPPADSSDVEDNTAVGGSNGGAGGEVAAEYIPGSSQLTNRPFTCCIRQYGISLANEEGEKQWQRMFGLFGTKIAND
ncbi:hypothetical protein M406DRAFT_285477 [Cryphonectria parasitica EP155]|uniref:Protection of telomeres protein 1 n=1 Tax=Cryphonectria parasitica (strain ATCC 38755 / EP155) TaxID=660469 RepID=A0A9P4YCA3_CRYP1|nr:uncharacterized protein M406DRAFT_285477 [Cryphonectria parasitica EP155]KAF3770731.1 hypothetical protein M406DRAFT_285477 [Cryphonectria parasitica EP155]